MQLAEWIRSVASQPWQFLLLLNIVLLLLGIFIEPLPAMLLTAPPFLPMAQAMHIDLMLMGVIMVMNLSIALYTPPGRRQIVCRRQALQGEHLSAHSDVDAEPDQLEMDPNS